MTSTYQTQLTDETYNGWSNYETWNVSLWLGNEYNFYKAACNYVQACINTERVINYKEFASNYSYELGLETPDGVKWNDSSLNVIELNDMLTELVDG